MKKLIEDLGAIIEEAGDLTEVKKRSSVQRRKSEKSRKKAVSKSMEAKKASPEQEALLDSIWGVIDGKHRQIEGALEINWGYDFPDMGTGYVERDDPLINMGASATTDDMDDAAEHFADGSEVKMDIAGAQVEFMGETVWTTVIFGADDAEPILGVTALESVGIEVDPRNQRLKRLPAARLK